MLIGKVIWSQGQRVQKNQNFALVPLIFEVAQPNLTLQLYRSGHML